LAAAMRGMTVARPFAAFMPPTGRGQGNTAGRDMLHWGVWDAPGGVKE
jgi:hypothetical protein